MFKFWYLGRKLSIFYLDESHLELRTLKVRREKPASSASGQVDEVLMKKWRLQTNY